ncbi:MAG: hypothetical protein HY332_13035 [Chloroflexi bacterium]|nr:hypothetical protein [Chloroflexota bacterium]
MATTFELGDLQQPKGHALLYFTSTEGENEVLATYVVVLPIAINPAKYIPPAFAARMTHAVAAVAATALPPIPETMESVAAVRRLAVFRSDDLLNGGVIDPDPERLMLATHEIAQEYAARYQRALDLAPEPEPKETVPDEDVLRWVLMGEKERIGELAKLTGQLRYALEGNDQHLLEAAMAQVHKLKALLPEKYRIGEFLEAARRPDATGRRLAELYIDRCYKLSNEEYESLAQLDREIERLQQET